MKTEVSVATNSPPLAPFQPMVDVAAGADAPSLHHYASTVDAAEAAVARAEGELEDAVHVHRETITLREREGKYRAWQDAVAAFAALQHSLEALTLRNRAEGEPVDAGSTGLRDATSAVAEGRGVVARVPTDRTGNVDAGALAPADIAALESAATRGRAAASTAAKGMDRRPELASLRRHLEEIGAQGRAADDRLSLAHARFEATAPGVDEALPKGRAAVERAHAAIAAATQAGGTASQLLAAARSALDRDAQSATGGETRELLPRVVAAHTDYDARIVLAAALAEDVAGAARASEVRRGGEAALRRVDESLVAVKRRYDALDLRVLPAVASAAYPQRQSQRRGSAVGTAAAVVLDPAAPPTKRAVAAVQDAGMKLVHADAVRVRLEGGGLAWLVCAIPGRV